MDDDKEPPLLGMKEEAQGFFDLQKETKNLTIEKKVEKTVFMAGPYKGYDLLYVPLYDTKYLKRMLKISGLEKKTKNLIKKSTSKDQILFKPLHQPPTNEPYNKNN